MYSIPAFFTFTFRGVVITVDKMHSSLLCRTLSEFKGYGV